MLKIIAVLCKCNDAEQLYVLIYTTERERESVCVCVRAHVCVREIS